MGLSSCQEELDWTPSYYKGATIPYGAKSLYELLPEVTGQEFKEFEGFSKFIPKALRDTIGGSSFESLEFLPLDSVQIFNLSIVKNSVELSQVDINAMDLAIRNGAHVLLAGERFGESIKNSYGFELFKESDWSGMADTAIQKIEKEELTFESGYLMKTYKVRKAALSQSLDDYQVDYQSILTAENGQVLAIRKKIGEGSLTICTVPKIFTNFHFLHYCPELVINFYSDFKEQEIYWGNDYRGIDWSDFRSDKSLLDFIKKYESLSWAWYLTLLGGVLFILSNMRRLQKPLDPLTPNTNMSLEYVETVAQLYRKSSHHNEIFNKKVEMFYGALYAKYDVTRGQTPLEKATKIAERSGKSDDLDQLNKSIALIDQLYNQENVSTEEYGKGFQLIEKIKETYL